MPSAWISRRGTKHGVARYRVEFRVGGRETATRYGGSFKTKREADERKPWVVGELAARRVPELRTLESETVVTLRVIAERWKASRVDVAEGTMQTYRVALGRLLPRLGDTSVDTIDAQTIADLVAELHADGLKKQTIRKTVSALAMVLDHAGVKPNPARDRVIVKMPRKSVNRCNRRPPTTSTPSCVCCHRATDWRRSSSTRPGCVSASLRR